MQRQFRLSLIASGFAFAATMLPAASASAGQPWSCMCDGKVKRTIASTYACESDLHKGSGRRVSSGFKLFVPRCTAPQFRSWNRRACAKIGCTLVPK
jgi:hypothetical protein